MILHRVDSIKESKRKQGVIAELGKQLSKEKLNSIKKDNLITSLGKKQAKSNFEIMQMQKEIKNLKGGNKQ